MKAPTKRRRAAPAAVVDPAVPPAPIGHNGPPSIVLNLPLPTSTNRIWRRGHSRRTGNTWTYLSKSYQNWKLKADEALKLQRPAMTLERIEGAFDVDLVITKAKRFKLDLDNRIKAALDFCVQSGLIQDDKFQNTVTLRWGKAPMGARLTLTPADVEP